MRQHQNTSSAKTTKKPRSDSARDAGSSTDEKKLQPDEATLNLPEVKDIPGQEHVKPPPLGELADTTISSDDEEGKTVLDEDILFENRESNAFSEEQKIIDQNKELSPAEAGKVRDAAMDDIENEGDPLNDTEYDEDKEIGGEG
jgi:hypothetical protein